MVYDRNRRGDGPQDFDNGRDYGSGRDYTYSSARDYESGRGGYGPRDYGNDSYRRYDQPNRYGRGGGQGGGRERYGQGGYGSQQGWDRGDANRGDYGRSNYGDDRGGRDWHGSYASDGRHFEDVGRYRHADDDRRAQARDRGGSGGRPGSYDYEERGFLQRAGDEVRSWFGDEDAERRREQDARYDDRYDNRGSGRHDDDYRQWRNGQVSQFDQDYDEYRQENRAKFESEFATWRSARQGQRDLLKKVSEHAEVVGSDGQHVGTVDKVRGDRIILTKNDADAGGHHHSIPSRWLSTVDEKTVTLAKTAAEAKAAWEDEDRARALFGDGGRDGTRDNNAGEDRTGGGRDAQGRVLNRNYSGNY